MSRIGLSSPIKVQQREIAPAGNPFGSHEPSTFASFDSSHLVFSFPRNSINFGGSSTSSSVLAPQGFETRSKPSPKRGRDVFESESATAATNVDQFRRAKRRALAVIVEHQCNFNDLPDELKRYVFSFLSQADAGNVHSVSWSWNRNASDDYVWSTLYHRKWHFRPERDAWLRELRFGFKAIYRMRLINERDRLLKLPELSSNESEDLRNANTYQKWGELFSKEAALFGTPVELARELYTVAIQQFHSAHVCAIDSADILVYWGDTLADLSAITPVSSSGKSLLDLLAKQKYAAAKSLSQQLEHQPSQQQTHGASSAPSSQGTRPSIFEELKNLDITWDNFYSDDEQELQQSSYNDDDDRMDTS